MRQSTRSCRGVFLLSQRYNGAEQELAAHVQLSCPEINRRSSQLDVFVGLDLGQGQLRTVPLTFNQGVVAEPHLKLHQGGLCATYSGALAENVPPKVETWGSNHS